MAELAEPSAASNGNADAPLIGVLALQGSVEEHVAMLKKRGANVREIRTPQEVPGVEGLVFPGARQRGERHRGRTRWRDLASSTRAEAMRSLDARRANAASQAASRRPSA